MNEIDNKSTFLLSSKRLGTELQSIIDNYPFKRKMYYTLLAFVKYSKSSSVVLTGMRKVGKSIALMQTAYALGDKAIYFNLKLYENKSSLVKDLIRAAKSDINLLIIDECTYMDNYESNIAQLYDMCESTGKKLILSGSSMIHLNSISYTYLGGRGTKLTMYPISYLETLVLEGKLTYAMLNKITINTKTLDELNIRFNAVDTKSFLTFLIENKFSADMEIDDYLFSILEETASSAEKSLRDVGDTEITPHAIKTVLYLVVFNLFYKTGYNAFVRKPGQYPRERNFLEYLYVEEESFNPEDTISEIESDRLVMKMIEGHIGETSIEDILEALKYLYENAIIYIDMDYKDKFGKKLTETNARLDIEKVLAKAEPTVKDMKALFAKYSFSIITPILYIPIISELFGEVASYYEDLDINLLKLEKSSILGAIVENHIKGIASLLNSKNIPYINTLQIPTPDLSSSFEVDMYINRLDIISEITISDKYVQDTVVNGREIKSQVNFDKIQAYDKALWAKSIKILTTGSETEPFKVNGDTIYRIHYWKLILALEEVYLNKQTRKFAKSIEEYNQIMTL